MNAKARKKEKRRAERDALRTTGTTEQATPDADVWGELYVRPPEQQASPTKTTSKTNRRASEERRSGLATQHGNRPIEGCSIGDQDCHAGWVDKGKGVAQWGKVFLHPRHPSLHRAMYAYDEAKLQLYVDKRFRNEPFVVGTEAAHIEWVNKAVKIKKSLDRRAKRRENRKKKMS